MRFIAEKLKNPAIVWNFWLSAPFIYAMIVPLVILDVFIELYHRICFPLYGIKLINRAGFIRMDRHKLSYLSPIEKVHCAYCGYANGLLRYACVIAQETEKYWCGIKHKEHPDHISPEHHKEFLPFGDEEAYRNFVKK
ncbi:MAG: hypothetical protein V1821_00535 [bacterium]